MPFVGNSKHKTTLIVGAGQAGYWVARTLRDMGFESPITLIGDEIHPPYERPPLSKEIMRGESPVDRIYFATKAALLAKDIEFLANTRVQSIDRSGHQVVVSGGRKIPYSQLVLATGGRARTIPSLLSDTLPIFYLRTIEDSLAIQSALKPDRPLLVIGGGWIGLEAAAVARLKGVPVTLVEAGAQLCGRGLTAEPAKSLADLHRKNGVDVRLRTQVTKLTDSAALLSSGDEIPCATVLVGVGIVPNCELGTAAGLSVNDGILVDRYGRTSDHSIYAAGDVARYSSEIYGRHLRIESWSNAQNQGVAIAKTIMGHMEHYDPVPWFWSDQYDVNLQVSGIPTQEHSVVARGDTASFSYSLFYMRGPIIEGVVSFNQARDNRISRKIIEAKKIVDPKALGNTESDLQRLLRV